MWKNYAINLEANEKGSLSTGYEIGWQSIEFGN